VPLSDHEQRLLEQMERALYAEDPKFATSMRGSDLRARYRRRAVLAGLAFLVGVAGLMAGAVIQVIPLGVVGFLVMLVSAWYAVTSWRHIPEPGELGITAATPGAPPAGKRPRKKAGFMERVEERWRRRRDDMGR
jgi:hypothetical protein